MIPIFKICSTDPDVRPRLLDPDGTVRLFQFGRAPQGIGYPYAVWQQVSGLPENYLSGRSDMDSITIQVDVYAKSASAAEAVSEALRSAIEERAYIVRLGGTFKDPETGSYNVSFDVDWHIER